MKFSIFKNNRGETIAETLIALSILAIGITLSSTLMANSLKNVNVSKNRVIAVNIAREGIEAIRSIRDTNWLKFSGNRRLCWNHFPENDIDEGCDGSNLIEYEANGYVVYKNEDHRWRLNAINPVADPSETILYKVDIDTETDTDEDGDFENDHDMYNHIYVDDNDAIGRDNAVPSSFNRTISIRYLENDGTDGDSDNNRMEVISSVTWTRGSEDNTVELKTYLTDYLGRDNLSN